MNQISNIDLEKNNYMNENLKSKYKIEKEEENDLVIKNNDIKNKQKKEKILILEIITSILDIKGKIIKINPLGYPEGLRQMKDGKTYFGYEEPNKNKKEVSKYYYILFYRN